MYFQRLVLTRRCGAVEHLAGQQAAQVVAVDPFHLHHADAGAIDPVVDVEEIVLLDLGDVGGDLGHAAHRLVVGAIIFVAFRREDLQRHREGELVGPAPLAKINHSLPARAQQPEQLMVLRPAQALFVQQRLVTGQDVVAATDRLASAPGARPASFQESRCGHGPSPSIGSRCDDFSAAILAALAKGRPERSLRQKKRFSEKMPRRQQERAKISSQDRLQRLAGKRGEIVGTPLLRARRARPRADSRRRGSESPAAYRPDSSPATAPTAAASDCGRTDGSCCRFANCSARPRAA